MPTDRPGCLLVDFFGTLVDYDSGWTARRFTETYEACVALGADLTYDAFLDKWSSAWSLLDGQRSADNREIADTTVVTHFLNEVLSSAPTAAVVDDFTRTWNVDWNGGVRYPGHIVDTVQRLAANYRLIVVSNTHGRTLVQDHIVAMNIAPHVEHIVTSIDVGWQKPHPAIYAEALRVAGVAPHEALFVGDNPVADYQGPTAVGIPAVLVSATPCPGVPDDRRIDSIQALPDYLALTAARTRPAHSHRGSTEPLSK